ncbi:RCC1 domain-containing protein [Bifidobacterium xylocopae]|uniref:RCC1-like domain-containing protein n=1 Tax=Bifidobacterium xylocopae TaxID=2493119 RepID=A0A366KCJ7_9BIFI|nr:InlB B-repeat-containing protein [Bifidobacterium xylocopae]RBP99424.1 hypothetical protein CRD59_04305 [Bifidobacterium xylocopae]
MRRRHRWSVWYGAVLMLMLLPISLVAALLARNFQPASADQNAPIVFSNYTVKFDPDNGSPPRLQTVTAGKPVPMPTNVPTKPQAVFVGWYAGSAPYDFSRQVNSNVTLTARWAPADFTLSPESGPTAGGNQVSVQAPAMPGKHFQQLSAGRFHALALDTDGRVYSWGRNDGSQIGNSSVPAGFDAAHTSKPVEVELPTGMRFTKIVAGPNDSFAFAEDGSLYGWGADGKGQLGDGMTTDRTTPVRIQPTDPASGRPIHITQIFPGPKFTLALDDSQVAWAWGQNPEGQLGDGTRTDRLTPVRVILPAGVRHFTTMAAGSSHSLGIADNGKTYSWGWNAYGQLGATAIPTGIYNPAAIALRPVQVRLPAGVELRQVAAPEDWSIAVGGNGRVYTWGYNGDNELGDGTMNPRSSPYEVGLPPNERVETFMINADDTVVLTTGGTLYGWGFNACNQIAADSQQNVTRPVPIARPPLNRDIVPKLVAASWKHTTLLDESGALWGWGSNQYGQLGTTANVGSGDISKQAIGIDMPRKVAVTGVRFDGLPATGLAVSGSDPRTWTATVPAHTDGPVTVSIEWTLNGVGQTNFTITPYRYFDPLPLPPTGGLPARRMAGLALLLTASAMGAAWLLLRSRRT